MKSQFKAGILLAMLAAAAPAAAQPVGLVTRVMVETRKSAPDGTTKIVLVPAARVTPGDRVVYQISYHNSGREPARDLVIVNPVPAGLSYGGAAAGSPEPELSVDGKQFGSLAQLSIRTAAGIRAATPADIRVVRWRLTTPVAAGGSGQVSFRATLR